MGRDRMISRLGRAARHKKAFRWAGAGATALGFTAAGVLVWPLADGWVMPYAARHAVRHPGAHTGQGEAVVEIRNRIQSDSPELVVVQCDKDVVEAAAEAATGRPHWVIDCRSMNDPRVLTWGMLAQMYAPIGPFGTLINSYCRAVYVAASLLTGNENWQHLNHMFFLAFLDYLSNGLRSHQGAAPDRRPVLVVGNVDHMLRLAAQAADDKDDERGALLTAGASALLAAVDRIALSEHAADCVLTVSDMSLLKRAELGRVQNVLTLKA
eukprot:TRINITY_DN3177_c1_g1_i1.p1 TRINITY_DN3177_c1_g1~~TRINITY_DN3177_c1_g1_i1.p1  ORF type:complete len:268 (+),score=64.60 TRINITY_DN3177_c1_g1_i1:119-922(+)